MTLMAPDLRRSSDKPWQNSAQALHSSNQLNAPFKKLRPLQNTEMPQDQVVFAGPSSVLPTHTGPTYLTLAQLWQKYPISAAITEFEADIKTGIQRPTPGKVRIASNILEVTFTTKNNQIYTIKRTEDNHQKPLFTIEHRPNNKSSERFYWKLTSQAYGDQWHGNAIQNMILNFINPKTAHMEVLDKNDQHMEYSRGNPHNYAALYPLFKKIKENLQSQVEDTFNMKPGDKYNLVFKDDLNKLFGPDKAGISG